ncbi:MAG: M13 family peptidase, partial [Planctomycetes bacterium]|nr:M13 family peptidase [Planctomycetota bacterium]
MKNSFICWLVGLTACIGGAEWNTPARAQVSGIDLKNISKEISPNQDFFRYINEEWLKNTPIPEDQSDWGSFTMLDIETKDAIRK